MNVRVFAFCSLLLLFGVAHATAESVARPVGRYQLFQGEYQFINLRGEEFWSRALFKLDTSTGEVWIAEQTQVPDANGKVTQRRRWVKFEQDIPMPDDVVERMLKPRP